LATKTLKEQLGTPMMLSRPAQNVEDCEEYRKLEEELQFCLEAMAVGRLTLIPELSDDGREVVVHVWEEEETV